MDIRYLSITKQIKMLYQAQHRSNWHINVMVIMLWSKWYCGNWKVFESNWDLPNIPFVIFAHLIKTCVHLTHTLDAYIKKEEKNFMKAI